MIGNRRWPLFCVVMVGRAVMMDGELARKVQAKERKGASVGWKIISFFSRVDLLDRERRLTCSIDFFLAMQTLSCLVWL